MTPKATHAHLVNAMRDMLTLIMKKMWNITLKLYYEFRIMILNVEFFDTQTDDASIICFYTQ